MRPEKAVATEQDNSDRSNRLAPSLVQDLHWGSQSFLLLLLSGQGVLSFEIRGPGMKLTTPSNPEDKNEWSCISTPYMP